VDVLLLDDVQFFMAKDKTQQEFFHTFNSLHQDGKQLVFSSDRPPHELEGFDQRLVSRLQWGLVSELRPPELETRIAILKNRAQEENVPLPDEVAGFIANHITDNVRKLQGALIKMMAQASLLGREISVDLAREIVKELEGRIIQTISVEQIQDLVAREFGVPVDMLRSRTRKREVARARQMAMYLATEYTDTTLKGIGLQFGGRDHSTVIHARETVCQDIKNNHSESDLVMGLRRKIEFLAFFYNTPPHYCNHHLACPSTYQPTLFQNPVNQMLF
jgi:chromosomal replication initiator protein